MTAPDRRLESARAAIDSGRYGEALALLDALAAEQPAAAVLLERGRLRLLLGDARAARQDLNAASQADPAGALGDAARQALLASLRPASPPASARRPRPRPHRWAARLVLGLLLVSIVCALLTIALTGRPAWLRRVARPTPTVQLRENAP